MVAAYRVAPASPDWVHLTQITDTHLFKSEDGKLLGLETQSSFNAVLDSALAEPVASDLILVTGDLAQEACAETYRRLASAFNRFGKPVFSLPGNHDHPVMLREEFRAPHVHPDKHVLAGNWQILMLDSSVPGKVYGELADSELAFLDAALSAHPEHHALVVLHHQPVPVGSRWLDGIGLRNSDAFFECLSRHDNVRLVLWGHVHQDFSGEKNGIGLLCTPSACVQFKPGSEDFAAGTEAPGYRLLSLAADGRFQTAVRRIEHMEFTVDYSIKGY